MCCKTSDHSCYLAVVIIFCLMKVNILGMEIWIWAFCLFVCLFEDFHFSPQEAFWEWFLKFMREWWVKLYSRSDLIVTLHFLSSKNPTTIYLASMTCWKWFGRRRGSEDSSTPSSPRWQWSSSQSWVTRPSSLPPSWLCGTRVWQSWWAHLVLSSSWPSSHVSGRGGWKFWLVLQQNIKWRRFEIFISCMLNLLANVW